MSVSVHPTVMQACVKTQLRNHQPVCICGVVNIELNVGIVCVCEISQILAKYWQCSKDKATWKKDLQAHAQRV
jgi:hypothetical protein